MSKYSPLLLFYCYCCRMTTCYAFLSRIPPPMAFSTRQHVPSSLSFSSTSTATRAIYTTIRRAATVTTDTVVTTAEDEDESTVVSITSPTTGQTITLIGTAHLSVKSNDQVQRLIETLQPNVVMVEMDSSRLDRIGIPDVDNINVNKVTTSEDIELPASILLAAQTGDKPGGLLGMAQDFFVQIATQIARSFLTNLYKDMGDQMNAKGGGEFLRAIQSAENCTVCDTVILGDRDSLETIQRAIELALQSGDPLGVFNRLQQVNDVEMKIMETKVREELQLDGVSLEESEVTVALMEKLKEDKQFRTRLFSRLEQEVPEFTQAFLKERDYLMGESIRRELETRPDEVKNVVGVVGLAHVPGMEKYFRDIFATAD